MKPSGPVQEASFINKQSRRFSTATIACLFLVVFALGVTGCRTTYNANPVRSREIAQEGSIVFVRPDRFSVLGTRSIRDYVEITYERLSNNAAGLPMVQIGIRNRGGKHWWDIRGPQIELSVKAVFYEEPIERTGPTSPPVYETNWRPLVLTRGGTAHFKVVCPVREGVYYQVTMSELLR